MAHAAIENLYATFAKYVLRGPLDMCPCCHSQDDQVRLAGPPLRQLSSDDLFVYQFEAMNLVGDVHDFKHFLPRILEIAISGAPAAVDVELTLKNLNTGNWHDWPRLEIRVVEEFLTHLWTTSLKCEIRELHPESVVTGLANARVELSPYLAEWITTDTQQAREALAEFIDRTLRNHAANVLRLDHPWWPEDRYGEDAIIEWLSTDETGMYLLEGDLSPLIRNALARPPFK